MKRFGSIFLLSLLMLLTPGLALAAPTILVDQGHRQAFRIDQNGPLHLSGLKRALQREGARVLSSEEVLTAAVLAGVDGLIISGPFAPFQAAELAVLRQFLEKGGRLAVMVHVAPPLGALFDLLGVDYANGVIHEQFNVLAGDPLNFQITHLKFHPVFVGLETLNLYGVWALRGFRPGPEIIASTSKQAWIDLDGNKRFSSGDAQQSFGVVIAGELGRGGFLVFGDDAVFQNRFLSGNLRLVKNLAQWLGGHSGETLALR